MATGRLRYSDASWDARCGTNPTYRVSRIVRDSAPSFSRCPGWYRPGRRRQFTRAQPRPRQVSRASPPRDVWMGARPMAGARRSWLQRRCMRSMGAVGTAGGACFGIRPPVAGAVSIGIISAPDDGDLLRQAPNAFGLPDPEHAQRRVRQMVTVGEETRAPPAPAQMRSR